MTISKRCLRRNRYKAKAFERFSQDRNDPPKVLTTPDEITAYIQKLGRESQRSDEIAGNVWE